jgi:hypothetical protein
VQRQVRDTDADDEEEGQAAVEQQPPATE